MPIGKPMKDYLRENGIRRRTDVKYRVALAVREIRERHQHAFPEARKRIYLAAAGVSEHKINELHADPVKWNDPRMALAAIVAVRRDPVPNEVLAGLVSAGVLRSKHIEDVELSDESDQPEDLAMASGGPDAALAVLQARVADMGVTLAPTNPPSPASSRSPSPATTRPSSPEPASPRASSALEEREPAAAATVEPASPRASSALEEREPALEERALEERSPHVPEPTSLPASSGERARTSSLTTLRRCRLSIPRNIGTMLAHKHVGVLPPVHLV